MTTAIALLVAGVTAGLLILAVSGTEVQLVPALDSSETPSTSEPTSTDGNATGPTEPADPEDVAHALAHVEWEVLAVGISPVSSVVGHVAIDQARVDELWRAFEMEGPAPTLPSGQGALVLPVAGSCDGPAQVGGIEGIVHIGRTGAYAAVQLEAGCAELPGRGTFWPPPHALYVIAVPVDVAERLAGVVAVVGRVADFDWEVLAVARIALVGGGLVSDQRGLDLTWGPRYHLQGPAPALAAGQGALVLEVPGRCDNAAQVQAVDAVATDENPDEPHVIGAVYFDPACAAPLHAPLSANHRPRCT